MAPEDSRILQSFEPYFEFVLFEDQGTYVHANLWGKIEKEGNTVGPNDMVIAAITLFHEAILAAHTVRGFFRIEGLLIENWK